MAKAKYKTYYYRIEFTYGDIMYVPQWGTSPKDALQSIMKDFAMIYSVKRISEAKYNQSILKTA